MTSYSSWSNEIRHDSQLLLLTQTPNKYWTYLYLYITYFGNNWAAPITQIMQFTEKM